MELSTLDVLTADGHTLKMGVCAGDRSGPSVLVVPGLFSHMGWYRPLGEALAARGATAFLLDRRGSGLSEGHAGHMASWRHVVDDIQRVVARIRELHPAASVCALGVSLGAALTLATSLVARGCFERHAALSPGLASTVRPTLARRIGLAVHGFARPRLRYDLPFTSEQLSDRADVREALWNDPLRTRAVTSRFLVEVFRVQRFVRRNVLHLEAPLLALLAGADALVDNAEVVRILGRVERGAVRIEVFDGAHHVLPASIPLELLVERIWHWFTVDAATFEGRVDVRHVPASAACLAGEGR